MPVDLTGANPAYSLQSVLTAQIAAVRDDSGGAKAAPAQSNSSTDHAAPATPPTPPPTNLSTHGIGASVNHQG